MDRRTWLKNAGLIAAAAAQPNEAAALARGTDGSVSCQQLELFRFEPKSMLQVPETHVTAARFPVIDFHTHISRSATAKNGVCAGRSAALPRDP